MCENIASYSLMCLIYIHIYMYIWFNLYTSSLLIANYYEHLVSFIFGWILWQVVGWIMWLLNTSPSPSMDMSKQRNTPDGSFEGVRNMQSYCHDSLIEDGSYSDVFQWWSKEFSQWYSTTVASWIEARHPKMLWSLRGSSRADELNKPVD